MKAMTGKSATFAVKSINDMLMKRVIIISTSLRVHSNSDLLNEQFLKGAESAGHQVEKIELIGKQIAFCRGCFACAKLENLD